MNFALDTQLLAYETPRRLLHGIAAEIDAGIIVLPEVKREVGERLKTNEQGRWIEQLLDDRRYSDEQRERIVREAGAAAGEWFADELARTDNRWAAQDETLREAWEARLIARNLPVGVVKRSGLEPEGDRLIVAQAAVYGVRLLTTNNLKTINHKTSQKRTPGSPKPSGPTTTWYKRRTRRWTSSRAGATRAFFSGRLPTPSTGAQSGSDAENTCFARRTKMRSNGSKAQASNKASQSRGGNTKTSPTEALHKACARRSSARRRQRHERRKNGAGQPSAKRRNARAGALRSELRLIGPLERNHQGVDAPNQNRVPARRSTDGYRTGP